MKKLLLILVAFVCCLSLFTQDALLIYRQNYAKPLLVMLKDITNITYKDAEQVMSLEEWNITSESETTVIDSLVFVDLETLDTNEYAHFVCPDDHHPHMIDLGLPSGVLWSCCNVGASTPEGYGGYYAWGETEEKEVYGSSTYKYYNSDTYENIHIGDDIGGTEYDVAHMKWIGSWRMPTIDQINELLDNCKWTLTTLNGVYGSLVTGPNGATVFLPAAGSRDEEGLHWKGTDGYYWSSSLYSTGEKYSYALNFNSYEIEYCMPGRWDGCSVRPVVTPEKPKDDCPVAEAIDLGLPSGTRWASWNVGASKPEEYGGYYAFGETEVKDYYSMSTYKYFNSETNEYIHIGDDIAGTEYDVAHLKWGGSWTLPSYNQIKELIDNCTRTWTQQNGVTGILVTGPNGNAIFLPAAGFRSADFLVNEGENGYCRSSSYSFSDHTYSLNFTSNVWDCSYSFSFIGLTVRAVCPKKPFDIPFADAAVKAICVANWDTNKDGGLSYEEAAAVKSLGTVFYEKQGIRSFNELQYFTGLTIIEEEAFRECSLETVSIPASVKTIGEKAFMHCPNLSNVTLPEGVTRIDEEAFSACALTSISLPESLIRIGEQAFEENPLVSITLPCNVAYLGNSDEDELYGGVFDYCYSLKEVNVDKSNEKYTSIGGVLTTKNRKLLLFFPHAKAVVYTVPECIEQIHYDAFKESKITSVTLPSTLKSFITEEKSNVAFGSCYDLRTVRAKMKVPFECSDYSFSSETYSSGTLYVPQGTKALYETTAGWSRFQNIVEEEKGSGNQCLKMTTTVPGENVWDYQLNYTFPQPLQAGKTYNVSITAKATNGLESVPFWLNDAQGAVLYTGFHGLPTDGDMTPLWLTFTAEADYKYLQFSLGKLDGDFFLDDFVVTEAGSDINLVANGNFDEEVELKDVGWQEDGNVSGDTWWKYSWINFTVGMETLNRESFTIEWVDQLTNGEMAEGGSMDNFIVLEPGKPYLPGTPIPGGPDGKNCIKITSIDNPTNSWDTMFFIYTPDKAWTAGEDYKISFWYRASQEADSWTWCCDDPGYYLHWEMLPSNPKFTTEWQYYEAQGIIPDEGDGMHTIAFILNGSKVSTDYYFADIHWFSMEKRFESASY